MSLPMSPSGMNASTSASIPVPNTIFVGGISWSTSARDLFELFWRFGKVREAKIMRDPNTHKSRGFGFVTLEDEATADYLRGDVCLMAFMDKALKIRHALKRQDSDPSGAIAVGREHLLSPASPERATRRGSQELEEAEDGRQDEKEPEERVDKPATETRPHAQEGGGGGGEEREQQQPASSSGSHRRCSILNTEGEIDVADERVLSVEQALEGLRRVGGTHQLPPGGQGEGGEGHESPMPLVLEEVSSSAFIVRPQPRIQADAMRQQGQLLGGEEGNSPLAMMQIANGVQPMALPFPADHHHHHQLQQEYGMGQGQRGRDRQARLRGFGRRGPQQNSRNGRGGRRRRGGAGGGGPANASSSSAAASSSGGGFEQHRQAIRSRGNNSGNLAPHLHVGQVMDHQQQEQQQQQQQQMMMMMGFQGGMAPALAPLVPAQMPPHMFAPQSPGMYPYNHPVPMPMNMPMSPASGSPPNERSMPPYGNEYSPAPVYYGYGSSYAVHPPPPPQQQQQQAFLEQDPMAMMMMAKEAREQQQFLLFQQQQQQQQQQDMSWYHPEQQYHHHQQQQQQPQYRYSGMPYHSMHPQQYPQYHHPQQEQHDPSAVLPPQNHHDHHQEPPHPPSPAAPPPPPAAPAPADSVQPLFPESSGESERGELPAPSQAGSNQNQNQNQNQTLQ